MESIIKGHNSKLIKKANEKEKSGGKETKQCNCTGGESECPIEGKCLTEGLIYKAEINGKAYYGSCGGTFKQRYYTHKQTFTNSSVGQTALSSYIHEKALNYKAIKWLVHKKSQPEAKRSQILRCVFV